MAHLGNELEYIAALTPSVAFLALVSIGCRRISEFMPKASQRQMNDIGAPISCNKQRI